MSSADPLLNPAVSVVVPAYNYGRYLGSCLASVLAQDHPDFEVLVVDDGSTDDTRAVVTAISDPRIRYIHQENSGLSAARNTGIRNARAPSIAFLDADDEWQPRFLSTVLAKFAKAPPLLGLVATAFTRMTHDGQALAGRRLAPVGDGPLSRRDIVLRSRFMPSAVVVRREVFETCGTFDTTLRSSEDRDMWIRIAARYELYHIDEPLVLIRKHGSNMSSAAGRMHRNMGIVLGKAWKASPVPARFSPFWLQVASLYYFESAWMLYDERRFPRATWHALLSLLLFPFPIDRHRLNEPFLFRLRGMLRFLLAVNTREASPA